MTVTYSTNLMGPISMKWFRDRGFTRKLPPRYSQVLNRWIEPEEVVEMWKGGRIDVYGLDYSAEIGLPIMRAESWNQFSQWLDQFSSETILTLDEILNLYYNETSSKIEWYKE